MSITINPNEKQIRENILSKRMSLIPDGLIKKCPFCKNVLLASNIGKYKVCPKCGYGFRITAKERADLIFDDFCEMDAKITVPEYYFNKTEYVKKIEKSKKITNMNESVLTGKATLGNIQIMAGIMDPFWIMGSLGKATGEKITRMFEYATKNKMPVVMFTASGGARMQEGMNALMQMVKVSGAVSDHDKAGLLYIVVLCNPTMGGVTASFGMQGDITLAEPHSLVGFAGKRVIEQTIREKTPEDFQEAEKVMKYGFIDQIVERSDLNTVLKRILFLHEGR